MGCSTDLSLDMKKTLCIWSGGKLQTSFLGYCSWVFCLDARRFGMFGEDQHLSLCVPLSYG